MEIKFNIEKKHFYFITILLTLVVVGLFVNANVDTSKAWHNIQQIATDNTGSKSLDENTNAIVDEADYAYSGGYWSENNGNVYRSLGNVGIGTSSPGVFKLNVEGGPTRFNGQLNIDGGNAGYSILRLLKGSAAGSNIIMEDNTGNADILISSIGDSYFNGGNVGIGTSTPSRKLDVAGDIGASSIHTSGSLNVGETLKSNAISTKFIAAERINLVGTSASFIIPATNGVKSGVLFAREDTQCNSPAITLACERGICLCFQQTGPS